MMELDRAVARAVSEDEETREALQLCVQRRGDPSSLERLSFEQGFAIVGSATPCSLRLDDPAVPARALYVQHLAERVVVVPLEGDINGPQTGQGAPPQGAVQELPAGVPVSVGPFQLWPSAVVSSEFEGPSHLGQKTLASFAEPIAAWEIANVRGQIAAPRARYLRHALTLVGSGPACRFRMVHSSIADIHASLVYAGGELQVIDLCSEYGVCVNGQRVTQAVLRDGDELRIGHCHGVIRWLGLPEATTPPPLAAQPAEPSPSSLAENSHAEGIVVSLSDAGLEVQEASAVPREELSPTIQPYSEEHCLTLVTQFLEMQQSVLAQTQLLMQKISERLLSESPTQGAGSEGAGAQDVVETAGQAAAPPVVETEAHRAEAPAESRQRPRRRPQQPAGDPATTPAPEFHAWLTHQLSELESSQRSGFSRLWERITGLK